MKVVIFDDVLCQEGERARYQVPGLELAFYENADEAVAVVLRERPDLVCMDFAMDAAHSGAQAVALLRQCDDLVGLRIVAISSDHESNQRMLLAGADDALPKTHLRGYLSRLADQKRLDYHIRW